MDRDYTQQIKTRIKSWGADLVGMADTALYFDRCVEKLTGAFAQLPGIGGPICGICIKVCPFGRKLNRERSKGGTGE